MFINMLVSKEQLSCLCLHVMAKELRTSVCVYGICVRTFLEVFVCIRVQINHIPKYFFDIFCKAQ